MTVSLMCGDARDQLDSVPAKSVQCVITSPPYFNLRDYGVPGQIGHEATPAAYANALVDVFHGIRRVLRDDGTVWLNIGDKYDKKQLLGIPWRVAFAFQQDGWLLRSEIIWSKPNAMPHSVRDRVTVAHEQVFLFTKQASYYYDIDAIREPHTRIPFGGKDKGFAPSSPLHATREGMHGPSLRGEGRMGNHPLGRNKRSVWTVPTLRSRSTLFAAYPEDLIKPCVLAGSRPGDMILDPFNGTGTTGVCAVRYQRHYTGIDLNPVNLEITRGRVDTLHVGASK